MARAGVVVVVLVVVAAMVGCKRHPPPGGKVAEAATVPDAGVATIAPPPPPLVVADNGLSEAERQDFYNLSEGSELYPLRWFMVVEDEHGKKLIDQLAGYGFVFAGATRDGHAWPVGLTVHEAPDLGIEMIGINCAACHVGEIDHGELRLRIDGAPNQFDIHRFYGDLISSTVAMLKRPAGLVKLGRALLDSSAFELAGFEGVTAANRKDLEAVGRILSDLEGLDSEGSAGDKLVAELDSIVADEWAALQIDLDDNGTSLLAKLVLGGDDPERPDLPPPTAPTIEDLDDLRGNPDLGPLAKGTLDRFKAFAIWDWGVRQRVRLLLARIKFVESVVRRSNQDTAPLHGRVDAFGFARNFLFGLDEGFTANLAPISYPHLWGIRELAWLHWNANTNSVIERNIGQALGVGAVVNLKGGAKTRYQTSVLVENVARLEQLAYKLTKPSWPPQWGLDADLARRGAEIYKEQQCGTCHDAPKIVAGLKDFEPIPIDKVGTDSQHALSFDAVLAKTKTPFPQALAALLAGVKGKYIEDHGLPPATVAGWQDWRPPPAWRSTRAYAPRSLAGCWATAPYLHNNSVPTLYQLLTPSARQARFKVGSRDFDTREVGYAHAVDPGTPPTATFDTSKTGNSNAGHDYFHGRPGDPEATTDLDCLALVEYLKTL